LRGGNKVSSRLEKQPSFAPFHAPGIDGRELKNHIFATKINHQHNSADMRSNDLMVAGGSLLGTSKNLFNGLKS
jgi:hypothetical protein